MIPTHPLKGQCTETWGHTAHTLYILSLFITINLVGSGFILEGGTELEVMNWQPPVRLIVHWFQECDFFSLVITFLLKVVVRFPTNSDLFTLSKNEKAKGKRLSAVFGSKSTVEML